MILDPAKFYADINPAESIVVGIITGVDSIPAWAMKRRRLVEIPEGVTVSIGDTYYGNQKFAPTNVPADTELMWRKIQQKRDYVKMAGVKAQVQGDDKWFHSDDSSRIQHLGLIIMGAGIPPNVQWKTMDGSFISMNQNIASQIFSAVAALDMGAFAAAETHKAAMMVSPTPLTYDFSTGWPETYL